MLRLATLLKLKLEPVDPKDKHRQYRILGWYTLLDAAIMLLSFGRYTSSYSFNFVFSSKFK